MWLIDLLRPKLPLWAYGLECNICKKTFISEQAHHKEVVGTKLECKHEGKIPQLR